MQGECRGCRKIEGSRPRSGLHCCRSSIGIRYCKGQDRYSMCTLVTVAVQKYVVTKTARCLEISKGFALF